MTEVLGRRALNRATLDRQLLLSRSAMPVTQVVEHLVGMQAQTPHTWYVGLWTRLAGFQPEHAADLLARRDLVRIALMRSTIHLVTPADAVALRPLVQPVLDRDLFGNFTHGKPMKAIDVEQLVAAGRHLLARKPLTNKELGARLAEQWPDQPPASLVYAVRNLLPLVQVPPRGVWGRSGPIAHTTVQAWLGAELGAGSLPAVILRYLAAFGPASVLDVQAWCGLTRLREVLDDLRPDLVVFRDENGRELFDLPDAPRPDPDTPAPPRFLYDFDNLLLSYADRARVLTEDYYRQGYPKPGGAPQLVLLDGFVAGEWHLAQGKGAATLTIRPYRRLSTKDIDAVVAEGGGLLAFLAADTEAREVEFIESGDH